MEGIKRIITLSFCVTIVAMMTMSAMAIDSSSRGVDQNNQSEDLSLVATPDSQSNTVMVVATVPVPEYPTIAIPLVMVLGLFLYYRRRRQSEEGLN
jgi:hypothetical protein